MKYLYILLILISATNLYAQNDLKFNNRVIDCEDKWVAFPADTSGAYSFGFVYVDATAGLTLNYEGTFKIDNTGKFIACKNDLKSITKYRLKPHSKLVALISDSKLESLQVDKIPTWLKIYKEEGESINRLYTMGFMYNAWNECEKALSFLEKAYKIDSEHRGLRVELAFSYNCLGQYYQAIDVLKKALKKQPLDAYTNKELIYAEVKSGRIDDAVASCRKVFRDCSDKTYHAENAYNILQAYFHAKDIKNFNSWLAEANTYIMSNEWLKVSVEKMKSELSE